MVICGYFSLRTPDLTDFVDSLRVMFLPEPVCTLLVPRFLMGSFSRRLYKRDTRIQYLRWRDDDDSADGPGS